MIPGFIRRWWIRKATAAANRDWLRRTLAEADKRKGVGK